MTTRELIKRLRDNFIIENAKDDDAIQAFERAVNETLLDKIDVFEGATEPAKPRKPRGPNKKSEDSGSRSDSSHPDD